MVDTKFKKREHQSQRTEFKKGLVPWNKSRKRIYSEEEKKKIIEKEKEYYERNKERINLKSKEWYEKNKERINIRSNKHYLENRNRINANHKKRRQKLKDEFFLTYKKDKCCALCGWKEHPEILQFHHKEKKGKSFTIGNISITSKYSPKKLELIKEEIEKCILICPNCHSLLHYKERRRLNG